MKNLSQRTLAYALAAGGSTIILSLAFLARSAPPPVLTITPAGGTQLLLTITNGVVSTNYEIYRTPVLNSSNYPWALHIVGDVGQTNFLVDMGDEPFGWFRAGIGSDWDLDGVPNYQDANPTDPTIGVLSITIDSPTNGMILQ